MLSEVIKEVIDYLYDCGEMELVLQLIRSSLNEDIIDKYSVSNLLNEMAIETNGSIDEILEIMEEHSIEISPEIRHRQFSSDIKYRLGEIVRFIHNEDLMKLAESRIQGIIYDLEEYLNDISNQ